MTTRDTRDLARTAGVYVDETDAIECESKADELVATARLAKLACVTRLGTPALACPPRAVRSGDACLTLEEKSGALDIAAWSRATAAEVCSALLRSPFGIATPEREATLTVELSASIPNNDLTRGFVRLSTKPPVADLDLAKTLVRVDDALRRLGGTASASDVSAGATCRTSSRRPISVP